MRDMRVGICMTDFGPTNIDILFAKIAKLGFVSTQLAFSSLIETNFIPDGKIEIPGKIENNILDCVRKSAENYGIRIQGCNGTFNMAHPDKRVRDEAVRRFKYHAEAVSKLEVKMIPMCSGTRYGEHLWTYHPDNTTAEAWADMIDTMKKCVEIAETYGIVLAVEAEAANIIDTPEKAKKMMDEVGSENLKMIMDCANLFHAGEAKKENVHRIVEHAFDVFGDDVVIAHGKDISESDGIKFCPTGEGIIDFKQFAELLHRHNYQGDMLLHGIFDEDKMPRGLEVMKTAVGSIGG